MLTRLKVSGFKNLVDVDVRFGPFTCIAGANGVGKSNLFDAIRFLSLLADLPLVEAARRIRSEDDQRRGDVRSLFHRTGEHFADRMSFEAEMIIPATGYDDLNQVADATTTFLRYALVLGYRSNDPSLGELELLREELTYYAKSDAARNLLFPHEKRWRESIITGPGRRNAPFISTDEQSDPRLIMQHQDGGSRGQPFQRLASQLPRTIVSVANALESPTALLARREMQSWRLLQLEPSAMRKPDDFNAPTSLDMNGAHLPATLFALAARQAHSTQHVYTMVANQLAELIEDVRLVSIDEDVKRELYTLIVTTGDETAVPAKALSDGTLRFLALAVLGVDPNAGGVFCMEEPENGIHPDRVPAMLSLLKMIATDAHEPVDATNPLRQVIINTHSPVVVQEVSEDDLLLAERVEQVDLGTNRRFHGVQFSALSDTWRTKGGHAPAASPGIVMSYVRPVVSDFQPQAAPRQRRRVIDRSDIHQLLLPLDFESEQG